MKFLFGGSPAGKGFIISQVSHTVSALLCLCSWIFFLPCGKGPKYLHCPPIGIRTSLSVNTLLICGTISFIGFLWLTKGLNSFLKNIYWRIVDLQCCVHFCYTAMWISSMYIYIYPLFLGFPSHLGHHRALGRRRQWHPTPVLLPGKSHGRRSLIGGSPWGSHRVGHD